MISGPHLPLLHLETSKPRFTPAFPAPADKNSKHPRLRLPSAAGRSSSKETISRRARSASAWQTAPPDKSPSPTRRPSAAALLRRNIRPTACTSLPSALPLRPDHCLASHSPVQTGLALSPAL